jgi:4-diphosphocytidyl-2-C-methyl-D-erythritol kinase
MYLRRDQLTRIARAPAKLNLYLEILGRRADGFHELETLMVPIGLSDTLNFRSLPPAEEGSAGEILLDVKTCNPVRSLQPAPAIPAGRENLVVRALELLRERSGCELGARVTLVKRIPVAAGLGGGSSDAAAALQLANSAWNLHWPIQRLVALGAALGSDVPFFLARGPALCRGRGERVEPIRRTPRRWFVIVKPPAALSTAKVYESHASLRETAKRRPPGDLQLAAGAYGTTSILQARRWMFNRLQSAAAAISPWVDRLRSTFDKLDLPGHQLTGSGSAYFGVCRHAQHAQRLGNILRMQELGLVYVTRSLASSR